MYNITKIDATTLPDAWFQTVYKCVEIGRDFKIDRGSYEGDTRLEFDFIVIHIKQPDAGRLGDYDVLIPIMPEASTIPAPFDRTYLDDYVTYIMTGAAKENESYTYGQRLCRAKVEDTYPSFALLSEEELDELCDLKIIYRERLALYVNQIELLIWTYKNRGHRNNQMCMAIEQGTDCLITDPPCLRSIDTRIQDGKLHFLPYFRSWDLFNGFPVNLAGLEILKQYMAEQIGVENGEIIASSKGLHIYSYVREFAELLRGKTIEEFRSEVCIT